MKQKLFTLLFVLLTSFGMMHAVVYNGTCGAEGDGSNVTWTLNTSDSTFIISGIGAMERQEIEKDMDGGVNWVWAPWDRYKAYIAHVVIENGITRIKLSLRLPQYGISNHFK